MNTKKIPMFVMLVAGATVSIATYIMNYELKDMLIVLSAVLVLFYILGLVIKRIFDSFQMASDSEPENGEEGEVIEKELADDTEGQDAKKAQGENSSV